MLELLPWGFRLASLALLPLAALHAPGTWTAPAGTWCTMQAAVALPLVASIGFLAAPAVAGSVLILGAGAAAAVPGRRAP